MDYIVVRAMCTRKIWHRLREQIPASMLAPDTVSLLGWIDLYWSTYQDHAEVHADAFDSMVNLRAGATPKEQLDILRHMFRTVLQVPDDSVVGVVRTLNELAYSGEVAALTARYQAGDEVDFVAEMKSLQRKYGDGAAVQDSLMEWESGSVDDILAHTDESGGLKLSVFDQLQNNIRGCRGGDCIAVAAPVDAGKTSLLASIIVGFAEQMHQQPEVYGNRPILWLVNESLAARTVPRIYQAATHWTLQEIRERHQLGEFAPAYLKKIGAYDRIRVKNAHSLTMSQIATLIEEMNPAVLVIDMVANIRGGTMETEHQNLESKWQELRVLGCEHDCIMLGTMQLSAEGYDLLYPPLTAMKQSKIGVQGALDLAIMMGRLDPSTRPDMQTVRGISTPKNKMGLSGCESYLQFQVEFQGGRCKFLEGQVNG